MGPMEYLKAAEMYVAERGDTEWFSHYYTIYRENFGVKVSAQRALWQLYNSWEVIPFGDEVDLDS